MEGGGPTSKENLRRQRLLVQSCSNLIVSDKGALMFGCMLSQMYDNVLSLYGVLNRSKLT